MTPFIKPSTEEDRKWAARMLSESTPWTILGTTYDQCLSVCSDPEYQVFTACATDGPSGILVLDPRGVAGAPYVKILAVAAAARGNSVGKLLLDFAEDHFRKSSNHLFLCVSSFNDRAQNFYRRNGFVELAELKDHIAMGSSELLFYKRIR